MNWKHAQLAWQRFRRQGWFLACIAWCVGHGWVTEPLSAGTVELRNGVVLHGRPAKLQTLTPNPNFNQGPVPVYSIVMVQTGWQRYYVSVRQIPDNGLNLDVNLVRSEEFAIPQLKQGRTEVVQHVGSIVSATPFDGEFGRRTVTLATSRGNVPIIQGIKKITSDHVEVTGLTHNWDFGLSLANVPQETIVSILHNPVVCNPVEPQDRLARARFYVAAEWYPMAFAELESIVRDFPDMKDRVETFRQELLQVFGRHVLRELTQRRQAGQFELADASVRRIPPVMLHGAVQRDVQQWLAASQRDRDDLDRVAALLGDLQASLTEAELRERVSAVRTQLIAELDRSGLDRMRPFLLAANDPQRSAAEKLALAITGWVLGSDAAAIDLPRALRLWEARGLVREYLRAENTLLRNQFFDDLRLIEGVGATGLRQMIAHLTPVLDAETIVPTEVAEVSLPPAGEEPALNYKVLLPPEYSPNRRYPCLLVLRPEHKTTEQTVAWWGGSADAPGWAQRRGYIVLAPEYAPADVREYSYSATSHLAVLRTLRDARLRFAIDSNRVYLAGHDMGGDAAFDIGMAYPDEFAGVIPIGGVSDHYGPFCFQNGQYVPWYVIRGELGRDAQKKPMAKFFDDVFIQGLRFDLIYAEFLGRGQDSYSDELPKLFDWMALQERDAVPTDFEYRSLRQCDNHLFWLITEGLPRNYLLPQPAGAAKRIEVMTLSGRIAAGNTISVSSPATRNVLRLWEGLVDFERKVTIRVNGRQKASKFLEPDLRTMLDDFRLYGDRNRLASVWLEF